MRTTLDIDEDILNAAKELAARQKVSAGKVLSDLARKALAGAGPSGEEIDPLTGFALFPRHGQVITAEFIRALDEQSQ